MSSPPLKIALVTGSNQGIGLATVKALAALPNHHVFLCGRDASRVAAAAAPLISSGLPVAALTLDVTSADDIAAAIAEITSSFGRLDILIHNAAIAIDSRPLPVTDIFAQTFAVNVGGPATLTDAFLPLLALSPAPRLVFVSSGLGSIGEADTWAAYPAHAYRTSKAALNLLAKIYAQKFLALGDEGRKWKVNVSTPGFTSTALNGFAGTESVEMGAENTVRLAELGPDGETGTFTSREGPYPW